MRSKVAALGAAVVLCAGGSLWNSAPPETNQVEVPAPVGSSAVQAKGVQVYVSGAVMKPGIYELPAGSRGVAAIAAAGGMTSEANTDKVNLAKLLKDGMQINVPRLNAKQLKAKSGGNNIVASGEKNAKVEQAATVKGVSKNQAPGKVHINSASEAELTALPGIGAVTAERIINYRSVHAFSSVEEIMQVKGIGKAKFAQMQPYLEL